MFKRKPNKTKILLEYMKALKEEGFSDKEIIDKFREKEYPEKVILTLTKLFKKEVKMKKKIEEPEEELDEEEMELEEENDFEDEDEEEEENEYEDEEEELEKEEVKNPIKQKVIKKPKVKEEVPKDLTPSQITEGLQILNQNIIEMARRIQTIESTLFRVQSK